MHVLKTFWPDAILCACHLINRMSFVLHDKITFYYLFSYKPTLSAIPRVFGSTCFIQDLKHGLDKLESRAIKCVFIGYFHTQKGYCCFDLVHHRFYTSSNVTFFESVPYFAPLSSLSAPQNMITYEYPKKETIPKP